MELTPQTLHAVEFREARRGGYNTRDVDDFLERVAAGVGLLHDRLRDAMARAEGAEGRLAEMQRQIDELRRRPAAAPPEVSETDDTLRRTLVLAQRTADATIKEAKDEAARLLSEAREEAARIHAEIEAEARRGTEGARQAAEAEIEELLDTRDRLKGDLESLERHIEEQRTGIRMGITELERVLDDPVALKPVGAPPLTDVERPPLPSRVEAPPLPARVDPPRVDVSATASAVPSRNPALPMRKAPGGEGEARNGQPAPEPSPAGGAAPFASPAAQVAALQEAPPLPQRPAPADLGPPTQPSPFTPFGGAGNGGTPWPSELRTSLEDAAAGTPAGEAPPTNGAGAHEGAGIEPGSRPSEWGRPVFEPSDEPDQTHFGGRRG